MRRLDIMENIIKVIEHDEASDGFMGEHPCYCEKCVALDLEIMEYGYGDGTNWWDK
jgi:hypothetical protein